MAIDIPRHITGVMARLEDAGFEVYVVGGSVRDALLGDQPHDWDLCTSARPEQMQRVFADVPTVTQGLKHGTLGIVTGGTLVEVTTYRAETTYTDHRHPDEVIFHDDLTVDLARRDFTINAMAYNPVSGLVDPLGGRTDLEARLIRCVGEPAKRFDEDALRILRALRFSSILGFTIEQETSRAIHESRNSLADIAGERIWAEFSRLLCGYDAERVLIDYADVIAVFVPELEPEFGFDQHNPFHSHDVWEHSIIAVTAAPPDPILRLALLLHDIGKPETYELGDNGVGHFYGHSSAGEPIARVICERLRVGRAATDEVCTLVREHMFHIPDTPKAMRRFLLRHGEEGTRRLFVMRHCDVAGLGTASPDDLLSVAMRTAEQLIDEVLAEDAVLGLADLAIGGSDLLELGFEQGPELGKVLHALLDEVVDGELANGREMLCARAMELKHQV